MQSNAYDVSATQRPEFCDAKNNPAQATDQQRR